MALLEKSNPRPLYEQIDAVHQAIHLRGMYTVSKTFLAVASDGYADIHLIIPADYEAHTRITVASEGKAYIKTYIGTTYTVPGTGITPYNRATGGDITTVTALHTTTPNVLGTLRADDLIVGGSGGNAVGGGINPEFESIVAPASDWLIRVQNKGGAVKDINITINYYLRRV